MTKRCVFFPILICIFLIVVSSLHAQDTINYQGVKFYKGQEVQLGYGSDASKNFVFIWKGNGWNGLKKLGSEASGTKVTIEEIVKGYNGKLWLRGGKVWIDI
jgi:hypothetical protein